jgi:glycine hydroxymethyltransferase
MNLRTIDPEICSLISAESTRQEKTLTLIPSENYCSKAVREAVGSIVTNKYSEGYPGRRYYNGNVNIDLIEQAAIDRAKKLFKTPHANVQPYSGSPANSAVYMGLLSQGDTLMGLKLSGGGHLTHGHFVTFSGKYFRSVQYDVELDGIINPEKVRELAKKEKPKIIVVGTTAYPRIFNWTKWEEIADSVGAILLADISHIVGLVVGGAHPSPVPYVDAVMTTTHKTLRGPRGAMIMVTRKGLSKDPKMAEKIDKAVFPGLQGGPHENIIAGIAVSLKEAATPKFKAYAHQIVKNAKALAKTLTLQGCTLVTGGTDNHLMVLDLRPQGKTGKEIADTLESVGIVVNRNSVPHDTASPFNPSGIRIGTPAVTTRGMKEKEMKMIGTWISEVITKGSSPKVLKNVRKAVSSLCKQFPVPS